MNWIWHQIETLPVTSSGVCAAVYSEDGDKNVGCDEDWLGQVFQLWLSALPSTCNHHLQA